MAYTYQNYSTVGINLTRQKSGALDISQVFNNAADLNYYVSNGAVSSGISEYWQGVPAVYPYAGQYLALADGVNTIPYFLLDNSHSYSAESGTYSVSSNNQASFYYCVSKASAYGISSTINPTAITLVRRTGGGPNEGTNLYLRILKLVNKEWYLAYQSTNSVIINSVVENQVTNPWEMSSCLSPVTTNPFIEPDDIIAIGLVSDPASAISSFTNIGAGLSGEIELDVGGYFNTADIPTGQALDNLIVGTNNGSGKFIFSIGISSEQTEKSNVGVKLTQLATQDEVTDLGGNFDANFLDLSSRIYSLAIWNLNNSDGTVDINIDNAKDLTKSGRDQYRDLPEKAWLRLAGKGTGVEHQNGVEVDLYEGNNATTKNNAQAFMQTYRNDSGQNLANIAARVYNTNNDRAAIYAIINDTAARSMLQAQNYQAVVRAYNGSGELSGITVNREAYDFSVNASLSGVALQLYDVSGGNLIKAETDKNLAKITINGNGYIELTNPSVNSGITGFPVKSQLTHEHFIVSTQHTVSAIDGDENGDQVTATFSGNQQSDVEAGTFSQYKSIISGTAEIPYKITHDADFVIDTTNDTSSTLSPFDIKYKLNIINGLDRALQPITYSIDFPTKGGTVALLSDINETSSNLNAGLNNIRNSLSAYIPNANIETEWKESLNDESNADVPAAKLIAETVPRYLDVEDENPPVGSVHHGMGIFASEDGTGFDTVSANGNGIIKGGLYVGGNAAVAGSLSKSTYMTRYQRRRISVNTSNGEPSASVNYYLDPWQAADDNMAHCLVVRKGDLSALENLENLNYVSGAENKNYSYTVEPDNNTNTFGFILKPSALPNADIEAGQVVKINQITLHSSTATQSNRVVYLLLKYEDGTAVTSNNTVTNNAQNTPLEFNFSNSIYAKSDSSVTGLVISQTGESVNLPLRITENPDTLNGNGMLLETSAGFNAAYLPILDNLSYSVSTYIPPLANAVYEISSGLYGLSSALPNDYAAKNHTHDYLPLSGGNITGNINSNATIAAPILSAGNYFVARKLVNEVTNPYNHSIHLGYYLHDQCDFYEYGGIYNFRTYGSADATILASITPSGIIERGTALSAKYAAKSHTHTSADITNLTNVINNLSSEYISKDDVNLDALSSTHLIDETNYKLDDVVATLNAILKAFGISASA